jgi:hypothetical protein
MSLPLKTEKIKPVLAFLLVWSFLNVLMNIKYPAQQMDMPTLFKVSPEVLGIMMIPLATAWMGLRFRPVLNLPLTAFVIFLRLFRIGDILVPMYFFRPFNLFLDAQFVPDLMDLLYTTFSLKTFIFAAIPAVILLVGISWGGLAVVENHPQLPGISSKPPRCAGIDRCRLHGAATSASRRNPPSRGIPCQGLLSSGG